MNKTSTKKRGFVTGLLAMVLAIMMAVPMLLNSDSFAAPKAPGKVSLTSISAPAYNKIKINWKKVSGATHYKIYYRKAGTRKWNGVKKVSSKYSSYTHVSNKSDPIVVGQKYNYTVKAYNSKTKKSGKYNTKGLTDYTIPDTVKLKKAILSEHISDSVDLSWSKANGCDFYKIYRKSGSNSKWKYLDTVPSYQTFYIDTAPTYNTKNIYTVKSYNSKTKTYGKYNSKGISVYISGINIPDKPTPTPTPEPEMSLEEQAMEVIRLTNIERQKAGKEPLIYHPALQKGAMVRAEEIFRNFSHTRPDGSSGDTASEAFGIGDMSGENICKWAVSPASVVEVWMNSDGHRHTMLHSWHKYIGVGVYADQYGNLYWVQSFAGEKANEKVTLTFNANGGTCDIKTMKAPYKKRMKQKDLPVPTRNGYRFLGWAEFNNTKPFQGFSTVDFNIPYTAIWEKV